MKGWAKNATLASALSGAIAGLATGCGGAYEPSAATRASLAGGSAGGAGGAAGSAASGAPGVIGAAGGAGGALGAAGSAVDAAGASGQPAEQCPTEAMLGEQLQEFDSSDSTEGWSMLAIGEGSIDWKTPDRVSCSGALHLHASFSDSGQWVDADTAAPNGTFWDWSKWSRMHFRIRLGSPGVGNYDQMATVSVGPSVYPTNGARFITTFVDASTLSDFAWHDVVVELNTPDLAQVDGYGVGLRWDGFVPEGPPEALPQLDLYVDEIWLE